MANAVCLFAGYGLQKGEAVILVMAKNHFEPVLERLEADGFNVARLESTGQLVCCEAEKLLTRFMFDGILDELKFTTAIGGLIEKAKQNGGGRPVRDGGRGGAREARRGERHQGEKAEDPRELGSSDGARHA